MKRMSYDHCPSDIALLGLTIGARLEEMALHCPDAEAVVSMHQETRLTFAGLRDKARDAARGLVELRVRKGDRVAVWSTNNVEWIPTSPTTIWVSFERASWPGRPVRSRSCATSRCHEASAGKSACAGI